MQSINGTRRFFQRVIVPVLAGVCLLSTYNCAAYTWRSVPTNDSSVEKENLMARTVRFQTKTGKVGIRVQNIAFPYIGGRVTEYGGLVEVDLRAAKRIEIVAKSFRLRENLDTLDYSEKRTPVAQQDLERDHNILVGKDVRFEFAQKTVLLHNVSRVEVPWVEGQVVGGDGPIRVDLRQVDSIEVRETDGSASVLKSLSFVVLTAGVIAGILLLVFVLGYSGR